MLLGDVNPRTREGHKDKQLFREKKGKKNLGWGISFSKYGIGEAVLVNMS